MRRITPVLAIISAFLTAALTPVLAATTSKEPIVYVPFSESNQKLTIQGVGDDIRAELPSSHVKFVPGVVGQGLYFEGGDNQAVKIHSELLQSLRKELSVSIWIKPSDIEGQRVHTIVSREWNWRLRFEHNGTQLALVFLSRPEKSNRTRRIMTLESIPLNKWTHLCYTYSFSQHEFKLYVNGEQIAEYTDVKYPLRDEGDAPLLIGMDPTNYNPYHGAVDELRVFDRALSKSEVEELFAKDGKMFFQQELSEMENQLQHVQPQLSRLDDQTAKDAYSKAEKSVAGLKTDNSADSYRAAQSSISDMEKALKDAVREADNRAYITQMLQQSGKQGINNAVTYTVSPFSSQRILPDTHLDAAQLSGTNKLQGAPSEMLTGSFVIRPTANDARNLLIKSTSLKSADGTSEIPASAIDVRVVKTWYQGGTAWEGIDFPQGQDPENLKRVLVPELLLHDASLVKVDYKKELNYVKLKDSKGSRYVDVSERKQPEVTDEEYKRSFINIPAERFPVADDAHTLQPLDISQNENQQFWLNVKVPKDIAPNTYRGKLLITSDTGVSGEINLEVRVLPIELGTPKTHYDPNRQFFMSVYYRGMLSPDGKAYIGSEYRSKTQFEAEMRNLRDHGINFVSNKSPLTEPKNLDLSLAIQQKYLGGNILFNTGTGYNLGAKLDDSAESIAALKERAEQLIKAARKHGYDTIYTYGVDELKADEVAKEKKIWEELHQLGIKIYVSGQKKDIPERFGDVLDILVMSGPTDPAIAQLMHQHGNQIFNYANPFAGPENPKPFRTNYGVKLWKHNYDSSMTYEYQSAFGTPWNDFDSHASPYRNINFTYPTSNGTVDTIAWEGYAQAYRDVKYASKLAQLIRQERNSDNASKKQLAEEANKYIEGLNISLDTNLDQVRQQIIKYILQLQS